MDSSSHEKRQGTRDAIDEAQKTGYPMEQNSDLAASISMLDEANDAGRTTANRRSKHSLSPNKSKTSMTPSDSRSPADKKEHRRSRSASKSRGRSASKGRSRSRSRSAFDPSFADSNGEAARPRMRAPKGTIKDSRERLIRNELSSSEHKPTSSNQLRERDRRRRDGLSSSEHIKGSSSKQKGEDGRRRDALGSSDHVSRGNYKRKTSDPRRRRIAQRHSTEDLSATGKALQNSGIPASDLVLTSWHSRTTASSRDSAGIQNARFRAKAPHRSMSHDTDLFSRSSGQSRSTASASRSLATIYGDDNAKAKARASRGGSRRNLKPGAEIVSASGHSKSTISKAVLYGDEDAKAKARASRGGSKRSLRPGVETVSLSPDCTSTISSDQSTEVLYGSKGKFGSSSSRTKQSATEVLYGNDADAKIKSKTSSRSNYPGVQRVFEANSTSRRSLRSMTPPPVEDIVTGMPIEHNSNSFTTADTVVGDDTSVAPKKRKKRIKKQVISSKWMVLGVVILLIGAGVTAFMALSRSDSDQAQDGDTSALANTSAPTGSSFSIPTSPPSERQALDPPSAEECDAIRNNQTIAGNDTLSESSWNINIEINIKGQEGMTDDMVQELLNAIQGLLLPSIAGCNEDDGQRNLVDTMARPIIRGRPSREMEIVSDENPRFAIRFASVSGEMKEGANCLNSESPNSCYIFQVELSLSLDANVRSPALENVLVKEWGEGKDLVSKLELGDSFLSVNATDIKEMESIESASPTDTPSTAPSTSPTKYPTSTENPTLAPLSNPTAVPTIITSGSPSEMPSDVPSLVPSVPPTLLPSNEPSTKPSARPSAFPTVISSNRPSVETGQPSATASLNPSSIPSSQPTDAPSNAPSTNPSHAPTRKPTSSPTNRPSTSPSSPPPTPTPIAAPSGNCGPLWGGAKCGCNYPHYYCNAATGTCGDTWFYKGQGTAWDCPISPLTLSGRCGPLFDGRVCECNGSGGPDWCNESNGWCGNTSAHRDAQPSTTYDCPSP